MDCSSRALDHKRSISLVCELGLLERCFAKLEADEDYGEALQARERERERARMGGARRQNVFLLMCKAKNLKVCAHGGLLTSVDLAGSCSLPSLLTSFLFSFFSSSFHHFFSLSFLFTLFFSLFFLYFSPFL